MIKFLKLSIIVLFSTTFCLSAQYNMEDAENFISSFVGHYESNPEGRYTHEYHPFLLKHTAGSLMELSSRIKSEGLNIDGRIIILGYEENAIPCYYSDFTRPRIDDEATLKKRAGWTTKLHNKFGFMTAFLFKDINALSAKYFPNNAAIFDHVDFEHLDVDMIPIFDDRATIFQEHAFDGSLDLACQAYGSVAKKYIKQDHFGILRDLTKFWSILYKNALKIGTKQVSGTQDILFSIEHVNGLLISDVPLSRFFVGPDLTYPIEISCKQVKGVTVHAQKFVKKMTSNLVARNGKKTVYIFCSFVDGVGKSTMLGNIKNWMQFGDNVDAYKHVDNTSSQLADLFQYGKDVFIADLPAQISHFTYKPDGYVYTAVENELSASEILNIKSFIKKNKKSFISAYESLVENVGKIIKKEGYFSSAINDISKPEYWFIKNLYLLKTINDNKYVPFSYEGVNYLFDPSNSESIRILKELGNVRSEGLKNVEAEQMLFCFGIRMPLPYETFLSDLVSRLKANGIEEVVFVDFLSMYPRSSRENLRINYVMQQLALLNPNFDTQNSFYRDFVNGGGQLLSCLINSQTYSQFKDALMDETLLRFELFRMIQDYRYNDLTGLSIEDITQTVKNVFANKTNLPFYEFMKNKVTEKLDTETSNLEQVYGLSKSFVNIQQLSFNRVHAFSRLLQELFVTCVDNPRLSRLWSESGELMLESDESLNDSGSCDLLLKTSSGPMVHAIYRFDPECKSDITLTPFLRTLRQNWYAVISNILQASPKSGFAQKIAIEKEFIRVIPYMLDMAKDGNYYLYQKAYLPFVKTNFNADEFKNLKVFNQPKVPMQNKCVECFDVPYLACFPPVPTNCGAFAFDCNMYNLKNKIYDGSCIGYFVQRYQLELDNNSYIMPTSKLTEVMEKSDYWRFSYDWIFKDAAKNGEFKPLELLTEPEQPKPANNQQQQSQPQSQLEPSFENKNNIVGRAKKVYLGRKNQRSAARLFIRLIATLEMIVKDPDADVVVRFGNKKDFIAALQLLEMSTLPNYFGILFKQKLFKDYEKVEPYPSWEYWNSVN